MEAMDRRHFLRGALGGAAAVAVAATGLTLASDTAEAAPVSMEKNLPAMMEDYAEKAWHHRYHWRRRYWRPHRYRHRRRRGWRCYWHRGRRVCGWRYW